MLPGSAAQAKYVDARITASGFGQLHIKTSGVSDLDQVYAAGLLEGWLTAGAAHAHQGSLHDHQGSLTTNPCPQPLTCCSGVAIIMLIFFVHICRISERIHDYFVNTHSYFRKQLNASLSEPVDWLGRQDLWARRQVHSL